MSLLSRSSVVVVFGAAAGLLVGAPACESCSFAGEGAGVRVLVESPPAGVEVSLCVEHCFDECGFVCEPLVLEEDRSTETRAAFAGNITADNDDAVGCSLPAFEVVVSAPGCDEKRLPHPEGEETDVLVEHTVTLQCEPGS